MVPGKKGRFLLVAALVVFLTFSAASRTVIDVEDPEGFDLDGFDLRVDGEGTTIEREDIDRADLDLEEGEYDVTVTRRNYRDLERTIYVNEGEDSTYIFTMRESDDEYYTIDAEDQFGNDLDGLNVTVRGEDLNITRTNINRVEVRLEEGSYTIIVQREGYRTAVKEVSVDEDERRTVLRLEPREDVTVEKIESSNAVCRGGNLQVDATVRNRGGSDEVVSLTASGLGKILRGKSFLVKRDETRVYRFVFTNVQGSGERSFSVSLEGFDSSKSGEVSVEKCKSFGGGESVENIDFKLYTGSETKKAFSGELVRVQGFADGASGRVDLDLKLNGKKVSEVTTDQSGYFETYVRVSGAGRNTVTVSSPGASASESLEVVPTAEVSGIEAPDTVFEGENFQVCARVESSITPEVLLLKNGDVVPGSSRNETGRTCFDVSEEDAGEYSYEIRALTYGEGSSSSRTVEVVETGNETSVFPEGITTVKTEGGLIRVKLFNVNDQPRNYSLSLEGVPESWFDSTRKHVYLEKGEQKNVYFYLSPEKSGNFSPVLEVEVDEEIIFSDKLTVESVSKERPPEEGLDLWRVLRITFFLI